MPVIRIVIATPSVIDQNRLERLLGGHPDIEIIAKVHDLSAAYATVEETMPNVVLVSQLLASVAEYACMLSLFNAVEAVPLTITTPSSAASKMGPSGAENSSITTGMMSSEIYEIILASLRKRARPAAPISRLQTMTPQHFAGDKILLIGASTGGIEALSNILAAFPANCPPTAIVQHTGKGYRETLVALLNKRCAAEVVMATDGLPMKMGRICLAGGLDGHLKLDIGAQITCRIAEGPDVSGHMPSIDEMFSSATRIAPRVIAVLLTGMGRDGAQGLHNLRLAGAQTIGQDEQSSVVYGMPRVAFEMGAVQTQLALDRIGPELMSRCSLPVQNQLYSKVV